MYPGLERIYLLLCLVCIHFQAVADALPGSQMDIQVTKDGDLLTIDASMSVRASPRETWSVMTDYDHMPQILSNLESSRSVQRSDGRLLVEQKGVMKFGPYSFPFESVREVALTPYQNIKFKSIRGSMRKLEGVTRLSPDGEGGTRIAYHAEAIPGFWVPPLLGTALTKHEVEEQFQAIIQEVLRRKKAAKPEEQPSGNQIGIARQAAEASR